MIKCVIVYPALNNPALNTYDVRDGVLRDFDKAGKVFFAKHRKVKATNPDAVVAATYFSLSPGVTNSNVLLCEVGTRVVKEVYIPLCLGPIK